MVRGLAKALDQIGTEGIVDASIVAVDLATNAVTAAKISGLAVTTAKIAASAVTTAKLGASAASGAAVDATFAVVHSEGNDGNSIQAGSSIASDVSVVVTFDNAFALEPRVILNYAVSGAFSGTTLYIGSTETTGFIFNGQSGAAINYIAIGSGRV